MKSTCAFLFQFMVLATLGHDVCTEQNPQPKAAKPRWSNGPPEDPSFFPIGVWLQRPQYADAYKRAGFNVCIGLWKGPTEEQLAESLSILGMDESSFCCSYCGDTASEWDHFRPLVKNRKPTGFISEIHNLVPACGKCNQSKGNKDWKTWMLSDAALSPKSKGVADIDQRINRLDAYAEWGAAAQIDFEEILSPEDWKQHWDNWHRILDEMKTAQVLADSIRLSVAEAHSMSCSTAHS